MGIEIRAQRNLDGAKFLLPPCDVAGDRIYADVQDLGIKRRELFFSGIELGHLGRSSRRPVERMKGHDQVLAAEIVARAHRNLAFAGSCREFKIRRRTANLQGHSVLQSETEL